MNENTFLDSFIFCFNHFLSHCFSVLSAFLSSSSFQNNQRHCEIIDCFFNVFVEIQLKIENLKCFLGARVWVPKPVHQSPKRPEYVTVYTPQMHQRKMFWCPKMQGFYYSSNVLLRLIVESFCFLSFESVSLAKVISFTVWSIDKFWGFTPVHYLVPCLVAKSQRKVSSVALVSMHDISHLGVANTNVIVRNVMVRYYWAKYFFIFFHFISRTVIR